VHAQQLGGENPLPSLIEEYCIAEGYGWVIDLDWEKFEDQRLLKLIRAFLNAGVMENGLVSPSGEGTPPGGPLSPLLSHLVLDAFDAPGGSASFVTRTIATSLLAASGPVNG
jgi:hypothetical protein